MSRSGSSQVQIVTDSNSGITPQLAGPLGVAGVIATYVNFGDKSYRDSVDLTADQFYEMLRAAPSLPTTAAPSVGDCEAAYSRLKGHEVVSLHISKDLSATIQAAQNAAEMLNGDPPITFIDTRGVNASQALLVLEAVKCAQAGRTASEIKAHVLSLIPRVRMLFVLDTLENLKRGGRISSTSAFIGGVLQMKPILTIKDGRVQPLERVRTSAKAIKRLQEIALQDLKRQARPQLMFFEAHAPAAIAAFKAEICSQLALDYDPLVLEAGPAVGTHAGPGTVGLAYLVDEL